MICSNNSILEVNDYKKLKKEILKGRCLITQIALATRFLIGDEFEYSVGKNVIRKVIASLKELGVSGGVTEVMIRYTYHRLTGNSPTKKLLNFELVRGLTDIKESKLKIKE